MSLWKRLIRSKAAESVDPLLGEVRSGLLAKIGDLERRIATLEHGSSLLLSEFKDRNALEKMIQSTLNLATSTRTLLGDEVARLDGAMNSIRGQIHGPRSGGRTGRVDRAAEELGQRVQQAMSDPMTLEKLIQELEQVQERLPAPPNGVESPI